MALRLPLRTLRLAGVRYMAAGIGGDFGSGAGKGSMSGGAVKEGGGAFSKMEAAHEELYFKKLEQDQLKKLRAHLEEEVEYHKDQIDDHKEAIERHKKKIQKLHHQEKDISEDTA